MIVPSSNQEETTQAIYSQLRQSQNLHGDRIQALTLRSITVGQSAELRRIYLDYGKSMSPRSIVVKTPVADASPVGERETSIYRELTTYFPRAPLVKALAAEMDQQTGSYWLVLEDVSDTHVAVPHGLPPLPHQIKQAAATLGELHAYFWEHELLTCADWARLPTFFDLRRPIAHAECYFDRMIEALDGRLPPCDKQVFETVFERLTGWLIRRVSQGGVTLIHGDAHASNFLFPVSSSKTYLVDWQCPPWVWKSGIGVSDATYFMVRYWHHTLTEAMAPVMLKVYFDSLVNFGVQGYSWEHLMNDFRACCLLNLCTVIEESVRTAPTKWYPQLVNLLAVIRHFECDSLLTPNGR